MIISDDGLSSCPERIDTHCIESVAFFRYQKAFYRYHFNVSHVFSKTFPSRRNDGDDDDDGDDDRREQVTHLVANASSIGSEWKV